VASVRRLRIAKTTPAPAATVTAAAAPSAVAGISEPVEAREPVVPPVVEPVTPPEVEPVVPELPASPARRDST